MGKSIMVHTLPDRKNNFRIWVDKVKSPNKYHDKQVKKSVYIRGSGKLSGKIFKNWHNIQSSSRKEYLDKIRLMEEIRQGKLEEKTINFVYAPRYASPTPSGSK